MYCVCSVVLRGAQGTVCQFAGVVYLRQSPLCMCRQTRSSRSVCEKKCFRTALSNCFGVHAARPAEHTATLPLASCQGNDKIQADTTAPKVSVRRKKVRMVLSAFCFLKFIELSQDGQFYFRLLLFDIEKLIKSVRAARICLQFSSCCYLPAVSPGGLRWCFFFLVEMVG